jgi:hypothetical protein
VDLKGIWKTCLRRSNAGPFCSAAEIWKSLTLILICIGQSFALAQVPDNADELLRKYASQESAVPKRAIVIGNGNYASADKIKNALQDAMAVRDALKKLTFSVEGHFNLDRKQAINAIDKFSNTLTKGDIALFYFAGHGIQVDGLNYIVPIDARNGDFERLRLDNIPVEYVIRRVFKNGDGAALTIIILDACRTDPFPVNPTGARGYAKPLDRGLVSLKPPIGALIAFATAPGQIAWNGTPTSRNSIYTSKLIQHISTRGVSVEMVFKQVRAAVFEASNMAQEPWESSSLLGDFMFNPRDSDLSKQRSTWKRALVYGGRSGVETYLRLYPASPHAANARRYLDENQVDVEAATTYLGRGLSGTLREFNVQLGASDRLSKFATVTQVELPVYSGPQTSANYVTGVKYGDTVRLVGRPSAENWAQIEIPGKGLSGFIPGVIVSENSWAAKTSVNVRFNAESSTVTPEGTLQLGQLVSGMIASTDETSLVSIDVGDAPKDIVAQRLAFERALELKERLAKSGIPLKKLLIDAQKPTLQLDGSDLVGLSVVHKVSSF